MRTDLIKPLPVALLENAARLPDKVAFADDKRAVTYGDLEARTRRLAGHLAHLGVGHGDRVAICLGNTVATVESYLAVVRAGGIGVPLNPASAPAELEYLLADSGALVVITDATRARHFRGGPGKDTGPVLLVTGRTAADPAEEAGVHAYEALARSEPPLPARDDLALDDVAWMFYTSGTTGRPKGVLSTQRNCLWSVASSYVPIPGLSDRDRVLWPLPLFHSLSHIACVLSVTVTGATARLVDGGSADDVMRILKEDRSTFLAGVPTTYHHLVSAARDGGFDAPDLRIGLVGGAVTGPGLRRDFEETFGVPLVDAYGSTETCGAITMNPPDGPRVDGSCGLPVPGVDVRIVDPVTGTDAPTDVEGEVWVSGPNVMVGYHNAPEATAEAIRDGWFRTGDLARRDERGYFAIRGRIKELVIRGGENIHPEEVEAVLRTVDGVVDAAVAGAPHDTLGEVPVAYVVAGDSGFDAAELIARCRERLSAYKVPERVREVADIPRTASGKTKRLVLAEQPGRLRYAADGHHDALTRVEWLPAPESSGPRPAETRPVGVGWAVAGPAAGLLDTLDAAGVEVRHYEDLAALADAVTAGDPVPDVTVVVPPPAAPAARHTDAFAAARERARRLGRDLETWTARPEASAGRLVLLTHGAVAATSTDPAQNLAEAALWGVVRSLQETRPGSLTVVDVPDGADGSGPEASLGTLSAMLATGEPQVAVRAGNLLVPRLTPLPVTDPPRQDSPRPGFTAPGNSGGPADSGGPGRSATVLVTGADTEHGTALAHRLATVHGATSLLLVGAPGSRGGTPGDALAFAGTSVLRITADAAHREPLRAALADLTELGQPVTAVVDAAGDPDLTLCLNLLTAGDDLRTWVAAVPGAAGLPGVAGATDAAVAVAVDGSLCEALVRARRLRGLPGSFLTWSGPTAHAAAETDMGRLRQDMLAAFDLALTDGSPAPLAVPPPGVAADGEQIPAILRALAPAPTTAGRGEPDAALKASLRAELSGMDDRAQLTFLEDLVRTLAAEAMHLAGPASVPADRAFRDLGFTSMAVVALRNRLTERTGLRLPTTVAFDHPTPADLAVFLRSEILGVPQSAPVTGPAPTANADDPADPVVIVGMACRLPGGVSSPEQLWRLVADGVDAISDFPEDRGWDLKHLYAPDQPERPGTSSTNQGGFLTGAGLFDAGFFGISPREALAMDPQQRLLLEASWEAFESAGMDPLALKGADVGVFSGLFGQGYGTGSVPPELEGFASTGTASSVASGRVSYVFGFEGPAVSVDTACSSSLVAMHLAAQALRQGECSMALAGGVTVMATPDNFVEFSRQGALSADGRCKAFADSADGTGWAEGVGVVVLERLSVARERGHKVLAVLRGSAVNQDGASNGLTAPNGPSQQRVIRRALASAGLSSSDVDAVEAHGTGTALGDPIEAQALLATYGQGRDPERPLWLGSLKSNVGHTQAAAGVAGVIKMVQALRHGVLPATLHVDGPTTQVDWSAGAVELLTEAREWPRGDRPRRAGVSSFGVSGTNAHLILEEAPAEEDASPAPSSGGVVPLVLSARSAASLAGQAERLAAVVGSAGVPLGSVAGSLVTRRALLGERAVVVADSGEEALAGLRALARGESAPGVVSGSSGAPGRVVWVFPGQGSQWAGMGRELLEASPVFAERITECAAALEPFIDWSLIDVLRGDADPGLMERVDVLQPASFAVMVGLAAVWQSAGVKPDAVLGHSQGEIAAAAVSGALSLEDAARVVALRSQAIAGQLAGRGGMASVALSEDEAVGRLERWAGRVEVAAVNGPSSVVIAGDAEALDEALEALAADGIRVRRVAVDYASHTRHVEDIRDTLAETLAGVTAQAPSIPFYSTVTGEWIETAGVLDGGYWYRNLRSQVGFGPAVAALLKQGHGVFVEVSAHPVLVQPITETVYAADGDTDAMVTGSLRREDGGLRRLLTSMAELFVRGVPIDWTGILPDGATTTRVELPTYAFDHQHYWLQATDAPTDATSLGLAADDHPLLGAVVGLPNSGGLVATSRWSLRAQPWLAEYLLSDTVVVPNAALVELAVRLGDLASVPFLDVLTVDTPVVLPQGGDRSIQVVVGECDGERRPVEVYSRAADAPLDAEWTRHAHGVLAPAAGHETPAVPERGGEAAEVRLGDAVGQDADRYGLHPALLDAAVRTVVPDGTVPSVWSGVALLASGATELRVRGGEASEGATPLLLTDPTGRPVMSVEGVRATPFSAEWLGIGAALPYDSLFRVDWVQVPLPAVDRVPGLVAVGDGRDVADLGATGGAAPDFLVYDSRPESASGDPRAAVGATLAVLRAWLAEPALAETRLAVVTGDCDTLEAAAVWGLVRSAQSEHPDRIVLLDLGGDFASVPPAAILSGEPQLRMRGRLAHVPRLVRSRGGASPEAGTAVPRLDPEGTVLITGGAGTLGALTARHLVTVHGVRHLLLVGRRGRAEGLREELTALGACVTVAACDVSDRRQVEELLRTVPVAHPLTAVVHTAGVLDDGVLTEQTPDRVDTVLRPKLDAALHLHELTRDMDLAAFVLFSSAAGVLGNPGQANYAAANACLDALARQRHRLGLPAVSIAWGYWSTVSAMTEHLDAADLRRNRRIGMAGLTAAEGMALLDAALGSAADADGTLLAAKFDLTALRAAAADGPVPAPLRALAPAPRPVAGSAAPAPGRDGVAMRLAGLSGTEQHEFLTDLVRRHAAEVLGHASADAIRADRPFKDAGFDSLTAVELRNRLVAATGLTLSPAVIFDYPKPAVLARHLRGRLLGTAEPGADELAVRGAADGSAGSDTGDEPIAIVAMACRFPAGVHSPEDLWRVVADGVDVVTEFPDDRGWDTDRLFDPDPDHAGTTYVRHGAFLDDAAGFDAAFFGISPNEALAMDPQQRLLLETSWEAFERAAIDPTTLAGQDVGVFVGVNSHDYSVLMHQANGVEGFRLTGSSGSVTSGRVAYHLGTEGPAITVDTACSSSLVALHLAAQALNRGECTMALAGGVMVMGTVETFVEFSRQRGLAPDGRCKAFADGADGTGWSEGAGLLLVERLSDARRNGHQVLAVVRGTAVNQDGASNGLTAPNGPAQQRVIRRALAHAGLRADDVDAVEAHGTGTTLGDPIEAEALLATYGQGRPAERPLWLGSVKSNIGHTQAAAGVAGVIKMVMAMRHGVLPRTLHVDRPSTHVDWSAGSVELLTEAREWPREGRPRRTGVSSFGIGGTNAHVILEEAPGLPAPTPADREPAGPEAAASSSGPVPVPVLVPVSGRTSAGLRGQADRLARFLAERPGTPLAETAHALATTRAQLDHRAVVLATDPEQLGADLVALAADRATPAAVTGAPATGRLAVLFTGQGSQWAGMGRELAEAFPVFRDAFDSACAAVDIHLSGHADRPLREVVLGAADAPGSALLDRTLYTQGALFALETALYRLFESWGVRPDLVAGHSVGEITAAHVSGVLGLQDAAELVAARGRLMQALPEGGAMVAVKATEADLAPLLDRASGEVCVAAVNGPDALVLSGAEDAVLAVAGELARRGHKTHRLTVSHAFHSALMEPMLDEFRTVAERLPFRRGTLRVVSTVTGELATDEQLTDPGYWVGQARAAVRFGDALTTLGEQGATTFLELGPGGVLTALALAAPGIPEQGCLSTLRKDGAEPADVLTALAHLHVRGVPLDWAAVLGRTTPATEAGAELPTYAFQHRRYWVDTANGAATGNGTGSAGIATADGSGSTGGAGIADPRVESDQRAVATHAGVDGAFAARLAGLSAQEQHRTVTDLVKESVAVVLGHGDPDAFDWNAQQSFRSLGFDSLGGVKLRNRLRDFTGVELPATLVFDYPTPEVLVDHLRAELLGEQAQSPGATTATGLTAATDEPIAIVAMSTRLPGGVDSPEALWELVSERQDAITGFPVDRDWDLDGLYHPDPDHPGTSYTRSGGFLHEAAQFDAALFGISPREALAMDPQQRLLLETSWEALERAGIDPLSTRGSDIGVFTGIVHHDYVTRLREVPADVQGYLMTGTASSVASGRVSYVFGFEGPAVTVDTACSSSLVAMHLAAQALRQGECSMALAGGATVMASPDAFMEFSRQRGLSADGRCKAFAEGADGTGWAEGVGVVVLERLSVARERGHKVLAVLKGSAVNQDGASNGLTAPNGPSQQRVIRRALASAGLSAGDVDAVEAHGTGTALGDPIEAQALLATYGKERDAERPLWLGSLKSNIGHAQAAAGVAGVIKMVQALRHGVLPATLHADTPTTQVDWSAGAVQLLTEAREWPREERRPRRAGVSSFGASGTNAHVILEETPAEDEDENRVGAPSAGGVVPLVLSARSAGSLAGQAGRLASFVEQNDGVDLVDVAGALVGGRAVLGERAVVVADTDGGALTGLRALVRGEGAPGVVSGSSGTLGRVVWVFPGQGSQWAGMGRELLDASPVFAERITECAAALEPFIDWSLIDVLRGDADPGLMERVDVLQPASFAVMVGLAAVWSSVGVEPDAVLGHSQGEIAAACVSGALSLEDAARVVALRSQAIAGQLAGRGGMASVALSEGEALGRLERWADRVEVAAVNGPSSVVIAGDAEALDEALEALAADGIRVRRVAVDYASHTRHVEDIRETLAETLAGVTAKAPSIPFYSTVTGEWIENEGVLDGGYWYRNLRSQVGFGPAVAALLKQGHGVFVEVSAHPVLVQPITETVYAADGDTDATVTGSLRREDGGLRRLLTSMAELFVRGVPVDWSGILPDGATTTRVELPTYAFDRQHYWLQEAEATGEAADVAEGADSDFWQAVEQADLNALTELLETATAEERDALGSVVPVLAEWRGKRRERSSAERLRYHVTWQPLERDAAGVPGGQWLVVVPAERPDDTAIDALLEELTGQGLGMVLLEVDDADRTRERLVERLTGVLAGRDVSGVLSLLALDERTAGGPQDPLAVTASTLALVQALADSLVTQPLWCLTRGAVNMGINDTLTSPAQAALWGLGRAAALERLDRWGGLVDLPARTDARAAQYLLGVLNGVGGEDQLAVRRSGVYSRRLVRKPAPDATAGDGRWQPRGTVLVTGGAEGLGRHVAVRLAQAGADRLVVTTTARAPGTAVPDLTAELAGLGLDTAVASCADTDREAITRLLAGTEHPLTAVVHAADITRTSSIDDTGAAELAEVFAAKVDTAVWLDERFEDTPLDAFVVFSSIAGVWGGGGQGPSGAANAVLDALVEWRRARGLRATAIACGALDEIGVGMDEAALAQLRRRGVLPVDPKLAVTAMVQAVQAGEKFVTVADMDWGAFVPAFTSVRPSPLLADLPEAKAVLQAAQRDSENTDAAASLADSLRAVTDTEQNRILLRLVRSHASVVLGHGGAEGIGPRQAFQEVGFDSLAAVNLRNSLGAATGLRLPATLVFDYPTPEALVGYLRAELLQDTEDAEDAVDEREDDLRQVLASVPFARFKEAGVLDALLSLADNAAGDEQDEHGESADGSAAGEPQAGTEELIDAMDVAGLVQRALGKTS
ncbi:type I polyketide synthase [Streptomyces parvulus]|uniref:type I polyketide synthase n=1 Tax=Streptomyces parvulus TaxID=146923 RepID=UPI0033ED82F3